MLKNHNYDLVRQLAETSAGLWRIEEYLKNVKGCDRCAKMWKKVEQNLEEVSKMLVEEIKTHCKEGKFE